MRKQITVSNSLNRFVESLSNACDVSQSCIYNFAITILCSKYNLYSETGVEKVFIDSVKSFYKEYFITSLPRGRKGGVNEKTKKI